MVPVDCITPHRQGLDNETLWLNKNLVIKTKVSDDRIQMSVFNDLKENARKSHSGADAHKTDARNQKGHFDGCTQWTFGQRMRARYGPDPRCAQPTSRMHATPLSSPRADILWEAIKELRKKNSSRSSDVSGQGESALRRTFK